MSDPDTLPRDAQSILELAARSMFEVFANASQGMFLVDRSGRIVWVNEGYQRFLPALGFSSLDQFRGHLVEEVIPNTQMRRVLETGEAILVDLLTNKAGTFVVSRIPLFDEANAVIGAIGIVLFDHPRHPELVRAIRYGRAGGNVVWHGDCRRLRGRSGGNP